MRTGGGLRLRPLTCGRLRTRAPGRCAPGAHPEFSFDTSALAGLCPPHRRETPEEPSAGGLPSGEGRRRPHPPPAYAFCAPEVLQLSRPKFNASCGLSCVFARFRAVFPRLSPRPLWLIAPLPLISLGYSASAKSSEARPPSAATRSIARSRRGCRFAASARSRPAARRSGHPRARASAASRSIAPSG